MLNFDDREDHVLHGSPSMRSARRSAGADGQAGDRDVDQAARGNLLHDDMKAVMCRMARRNQKLLEN